MILPGSPMNDRDYDIVISISCIAIAFLPQPIPPMAKNGKNCHNQGRKLMN
jgi:hypothetical protein